MWKGARCRNLKVRKVRKGHARVGGGREENGRSSCCEASGEASSEQETEDLLMHYGGRTEEGFSLGLSDVKQRRVDEEVRWIIDLLWLLRENWIGRKKEGQTNTVRSWL